MATIPSPAYSMSSRGRIGQPAAEPIGTHRSVSAAGDMAMNSGTTRRPRAENATTNEAR